MKPGVIAAFIAVAISFLPSLLHSEDITDQLSYDGQIRWRFETDKKSFEKDSKVSSFHDLRTRLALKFEPSERITAYIQFQDSRRFGVKGSGDLQSLNNVDLNQVYFILHNLPFKNIHFKAGRFEVNYGNQRVFGAVGWHNVGRSWDGVLASYRDEIYRIDLFNLKKMELNDASYNRDFDIFGIYVSAEKIGASLLFFYEYYSHSDDYIQEKLKRFNVAGFYAKKFKTVDFTIQGNYQFGEMPRDTLPDQLVQDIAALMAAAEFGYTFHSDNPARIAAGIDYTSGDDGSDSTKFKAYQNDYYTGHAFRGYMDYFVGSPDHGLIDLMFRSSFNYQREWVFKGDVHYFRAAEDYLSKSDGTTLTKNIGMEIDLTVVNKSVEGATFTGGVSAFFADKHYSSYGDNSDPGLWAYFMTTINFDSKE